MVTGNACVSVAPITSTPATSVIALGGMTKNVLLAFVARFLLALTALRSVLDMLMKNS